MEKSENTEPPIHSIVSVKLDTIKEPVEEESGIPDGGYGWVILAACLFIRVIISGLTVSYGLFLNAFVEEFQKPVSTMSWMAAMLSSSYLIISPVSSVLATQYGHRKVAMVGSIAAGFFFASSYFYNNVWFVFISASVLTGISMGCTYMSTTVILTTYFEKYLSIVMGIFSAGSGIASFVITPFISYVIKNHGWKFAMLIYGGFFWIAALLTITFRPVQLKKKVDEVILKTNLNAKEEEENNIALSSINIPREDAYFGSKNSFMCTLFNVQNQNPLQKSLEDGANQINIPSIRSTVNIAASNHSLVNLPISALVGMSVASNLNAKPLTTYKNIDNTFNQEERCNELEKSCRKQSGYLSLLKNPTFLIFLGSNFLTHIGYDTIFMYSKQKAIQAGIDDMKATLLLTAIGVSSVVGRLFFGFLGSRKEVNPYPLSGFCVIVAGSCLLLHRIAFYYPIMVILNIGFGSFVGGWVALNSVVLRQILDVNDFSDGLGLTFVAQATGLFLCSPLSGFIFDKTGTFVWSFITSGTLIVISGIVLFFAYLFKSGREALKKK